MLRNLLQWRGLGALLLSPWPLRLCRLGLFALLLGMLAWGWHQHAIPGVAVPDPLMYGNLTTQLFWVWWMFAVVLLALFFGRAWCAVCPVGWLNEVMARFGLARPLPGWLDNFVPVTLTLVLLQLAVYLFAIHRYPDYTARLIGLMLLLALLLGLVFRKRAFCSLFCPAGAVLGLYARIAPWQLRVADEAVCAGCAGRECVSGGRHWTRLSLGSAVLYWHGRRRECPVDLLPPEVRDSSACQLCLQCARNCPHQNLCLGGRGWLADLVPGSLSVSENFFLLVLLGLLTANFTKFYVELRETIFWLPEQAAALLGWETAGYYLLATLWVTLALPVLLLLPGWLLLKLGRLRFDPQAEPPAAAGLPVAKEEPGFRAGLGALALPCLPLLLAAHLVMGLVKVNAKAGFLPYALQDPSGVKSYLAMNVMQLAPPPGILIPLDLLKWLVLAILLAGFAGALLAVRRMADRLGILSSSRFGQGAAGLVVLCCGALYIGTVVQWLFLR
ncbi:4Fe-4S binding protein [Desulfuromonas acetexigens]|uniref:4Fe-4S binding protein n=1 Tax=Trichloromonas acetexigens TaxID=38815 RepID=A0A550JDL0_9BACT|nr:4Fe-4S binding protein [Desulfuromonas acetexigens]TRO81276.1 4Fe-4S binding protein [Desulfuromonas acetexigens]